MSGAVDWQPLLEKTIIALVSPLGTAWFLGLLAVLLAAWGRRRLAAFMGVLALAWLGVWSLPVASHTLRGAIEAQHPLLAMDAVPRAQAIVVLGGGVLPARHKGQPSDLQEAADRLTHGTRLFRAGKAPLLVLSGGSNRAVSATSEAEAMRQLLLEWGVPAHGDVRGVFVEMLKTPETGQFSFFTAHPGITRGGHYHHTKTEKFLVIKGHARFGFRHMLTNEVHHIETQGDKPQVVETVPGWTHDITNIGNDEMVVMLWANEIFDRERPDTVASKVAAG